MELLQKLLKKNTVPFVHVEGSKTITRIQYISEVEKSPNSLFDPFSVLDWEIRSDQVQFFTLDYFNRRKSAGWGYVGDIAGLTVDLTRKVILPEITSAGVGSPPTEDGKDDLTIKGDAIRQDAIPPWKTETGEQVPCVIVKGQERIQEMHFIYCEKVGNVLLDLSTKSRYAIAQDTQIEIAMPDGKIAGGWICDESGWTISISRNITIKALLRNKQGIPILTPDKQPVEVEVGINWSGRLGKYVTNDKVTRIWNSEVSGQEKLIFGLLLFFVGNVIGVVAHL
jgi:hypothetical protein